ncbi:MAG: hypothetical protein AABZ00_10740 [Chloroflexota bacterium]
MNHIKRLWGHYLALMILITILAFPIYLIYRFFLNSFGNEAGLFSLTITVMVVAVFGVRGAVHTHMIIRNLRRGINDSNGSIPPAKTTSPLVLKIFKIEQRHSQSLLSEASKSSEQNCPAPHPFLSFPKKRRGKQPRFPEEKIRKAVLRWESRDPSFSVRTLEEFLAQEFGSSPDGILLMATTTFYDWRRRILKELEAHEKKP